MPASLYAGDYARAAWKINNGFSPALCAFLAKQNPMTSALKRTPDVRRQEAA